MIVAVREYFRLRQRLADQKLEGRDDGLALLAGELEREMPVEEPLGHQCQLAGEGDAVVGRELRGRGRAAQLNLRERLQRIAIEPLRVTAGAELRQVMRASQVFEQHESQGHVRLVYVRDVDSERL